MIKNRAEAESAFNAASNLLFDGPFLEKSLWGIYRVSLIDCPDIPGHQKYLYASFGHNYFDFTFKKYKGGFFDIENCDKYAVFDYGSTVKNRPINPPVIAQIRDVVKLLSTEPVTMIGQMVLNEKPVIYFTLEKKGELKFEHQRC